MESASNLECSDSLIIFAFKEKVYPRVRRCFAFERGIDQCVLGLWCRCEVGQRFTCEYWRMVNILLDALVGSLDGRSVEDRSICELRHLWDVYDVEVTLLSITFH